MTRPFRKHIHHSRRHGDDGDRADWLYGRRPVLEALRAGRRQMFELWIAPAGGRGGEGSDELTEIHERAVRAGASVKLTDRDALSDRFEGANHQGVALRTGSYPYWGFDQTLHAVKQDPAALVLIRDHIEDPQNVGSILRSADATGVTGVMLPEDRASGVTAAAVRASAGASEHVRVARVVNLARTMAALKDAGCWLTGLDVGDDAKPYTAIDLTGRCGLVIGNEGSGLGRLIRERCDFIARIPMLGRVASLNAGVAGALVMFEARRQRAGTDL